MSTPSAGARTFQVALVVVALVPRLLVALTLPGEPVWDGHYYHFGAERIAAGLGYSEDVVLRGVPTWKPWCHYPVGYSAFLAVPYALFGARLAVAPVANALLGAALAWLTWRLGRTALAEPRARLAGWLVALHPGLILYTAVVMNETLSATLLVAVGLVVVAGRRPWAVGAGGALLGLATLVRPSLLAVALLVPLVTLAPFRERLLRAGAVLAVALAVTLPWSLRNCAVMDGCAFVSTNGGWNLAIGALTETGRFTTLRAADGCPVVTGQVQQDRCWAAVGRQRIREDPARWLSLAPRKLSHTFDHQSFPVEYLREARPALWPESRRALARAALTVFHQALLVLAAFGVLGAPWSAGRAGRPRAALLQGMLALGVAGLAALFWAQKGASPFWALVVATIAVAALPLPGAPALPPALRWSVGVIAVTAATHVAFFGDDRYHVVALPAFCLLAAAAWRPPGTSADERPPEARGPG